MINLDICLSEIPQDARRTGKNNKVYTNIVVDKMKQVDQYGNTHTVYMAQTKEERAAKKDKVYIGKAKEFIFENNTVSNGNYPPEDNLPF
jgi:hypothetical protein